MKIEDEDNTDYKTPLMTTEDKKIEDEDNTDYETPLMKTEDSNVEDKDETDLETPPLKTENKKKQDENSTDPLNKTNENGENSKMDQISCDQAEAFKLSSDLGTNNSLNGGESRDDMKDKNRMEADGATRESTRLQGGMKQRGERIKESRVLALENPEDIKRHAGSPGTTLIRRRHFMKAIK